MPASLAQLVGQKLLWSFQGHTPPPDFLAALQAGKVSGLTLFRSLNLDQPAQIHELISAVQRAKSPSARSRWCAMTRSSCRCVPGPTSQLW